MSVKHPNRANTKSGFTLPEVMVASTVLVIVAVSFTAAFMSAVRQHRLASNYTSASLVAKNRIQRARSIDYGSVTLLEETNASVNVWGSRDLDGAYLRATSVDTNTIPNCCLVTVQVWYPTWRGIQAGAPVTIQTILTEGLQ